MSCPAGFTFDTERKAPFAAITETLKPGELFVHWDYDILWTENHIPASRLEPLRKVGDVLADNALEVLKVKPGQDGFKALLEYTSRPENEQESPAPQLLMDQMMTVPEWVDWEQVRRGQEVYWRYHLFIINALLHFSLAGGFAIPKIAKVLNSTGFLNGKKTKQRVMETAQFILDVTHSLEYLQPGTGVAWESIIRVRLLHANVRTRLSRLSRAHSKYYNVEEHGVPINQEDLLATLFSFSNTMWRVMEKRMDVHMAPQEREDYLHLWRYVGYMMGVDDVLGVTHSPELADACLESIVLHLADPDSESGRSCASLLQNIAPQPIIPTKIITAIGLPDPYKIHLALAEHLLGKELWKDNGLPTMSPGYHLITKGIINFMVFDLWLVNKWPWWFRMRSPWIRDGHYLYISSAIGKKRTHFELKALPQLADMSSMSIDDAKNGKRVTISSFVGRAWPMVLTAATAAVGMALALAQVFP
ncbi:hypothetical protein EDD21DRAFT_334158 [Dissophora ornata]|nr:hypothetical protein BGZ58_008833 [Dissophora ornata]KAI8603719.1 hypothetical protein EDD21DRAFT_334158 [Dissophora ornata]